MMRTAGFLICSLALSQSGICFAQAPLPQAEERPLADSPAPPTSEEQIRILEAARENALRYTKSLPDFLCTQTVHRYSGTGNRLKLEDTLEVAVGYTSKGEQYKLEKIDGKPTLKTLAKVGGVTGRGEFGSLLKDVFRGESAAAFHWLRWTGLNGRRAHVYSYEIPQDHSTYRINWATLSKQYRMIAAFHGEVFVDAETQQVLRITSEADGIPSDWPLRRTFGSLDYGMFEVAGTQFLLPRRVEADVVLKSGARRNVSDFGNYRRFAGDATIVF